MIMITFGFRHLFLLLSLCLCYNYSLRAQQNEHIAHIRQQFKIINDRCSSISPKLFRTDTLYANWPVEMKSWTYNGNEIKLQVVEYPKRGKVISDYYFSDRGFIFAFRQEHLKDELGGDYIRENRYYFKEDDILIRWLDEDKKEVNPQSDRFQKRSSDIWNDMHAAGEIFFIYGKENKANASIDQVLYIENDNFIGVILGESLNSFRDRLSKGEISTGEGDFEVYYIQHQSLGTVGYIVPDDADVVHSIVITSSKAVTADGLKIDDTYGEIKSTLGDVEAHGSELEGRTTIQKGNITYVLDVNFYDYQIDENQIDDQVKIKEIILSQKK